MKGKHNHRTTLLVTEDPALEDAARDVAKDLGEALRLAKDGQAASCTAFDAAPEELVAIVDMEPHTGSRSTIQTMAGLAPVVAVTHKTKPWLRSMLQHHRVQAEVSKPVSPETLKEAVCRARDTYGNDTALHN